MKPGNGQLHGGLAEGELLSSDSRGCSVATAVDAGRIVREACRRFARDVDWQHRAHIASNGGGDDPGPGCRLSENHEGLHSGRYISVNVARAANSLVVRGGYYDRCRQPQAVYRQAMPLGEVTAQSLGCLLMEMHDGLDDHIRGRFT